MRAANTMNTHDSDNIECNMTTKKKQIQNTIADSMFLATNRPTQIILRKKFRTFDFYDGRYRLTFLLYCTQVVVGHWILFFAHCVSHSSHLLDVYIRSNHWQMRYVCCVFASKIRRKRHYEIIWNAEFIQWGPCALSVCACMCAWAVTAF